MRKPAAQAINEPRTLQVSCVQLHWAKPLERNLRSTLRYIRQAAEEGSRVVLFPEANLTGYKRPKVVEFRNDLPKTPVGKVLRRELRDTVK